MERPSAVSEASSSRDAPAYDYSSFPGYRSSASYYTQQPSFETQPISRDGHGGYADHLSRETYKEAGDGIAGDYSYTSSYHDVSRRYGSDGGSYLSEAYKGGSFDGTSPYYYESSHRPSATLLESGLSQDVGSRFGGRQHAFPDERITDRFYDDMGSQISNLDFPTKPPMGSQKRDFDYATKPDMGSEKRGLGNATKPDVMPYMQSTLGGRHYLDHEYSYSLNDYNYEQPSSVYDATIKDSVTGARMDDKNVHLPASNYGIPPSGLYLPSSDTLSSWRSDGGVQGAQEESEWKGFNSLSRQDTLDRAGSSSRFMDGSAYAELREHEKRSVWNEGALRQAELGIGQSGNARSLSHTTLVAHGSKLFDLKETSMRVQGVIPPKPANAGKKRASRWEPVEENANSGQDDAKKKKKKSRWAAEKSPAKEASLPDLLKEIPTTGVEIVALRTRLLIINQKLQTGQVLDNLNAEKSPSPEPILDNFGFRVNTRENRAREKLNKERQKIMARLAENLTSFKLTDGKPSKLTDGKPSKLTDGKPSKISKKVYIPADKYPDYNFVGLIIGPRGNTQKKMEKESGAKIFIRGKGSVKDGSTHAVDNNESLHVLIEADSEDSINKASQMVEKLLVPLEDKQNQLKRAQLRELACINGKLRDFCFECKEPGHISTGCPTKGLAAGSSIGAAQKGGAATNSEICNNCQGPGPKHLKKECPTNFSTTGPSLIKAGSIGGNEAAIHGDNWINNELDNTLIYVAFLPPTADDAYLSNLFSPFGQIVNAKVMKNATTGLSKSYGFVKFLDASDAAQAVALMNGYQMDGKVLVVKYKTKSEVEL